MDRIDQKILALLQADASIANYDLAERVGLAPSSCLRRVRQLKADRIITRTIALVDAKKMGRSLKVIVTVVLADHGKMARLDWLDSLKNESVVSQVYSVSGASDMVIVMNLADMDEFHKVCDRLFSENQNVLQFTSMFVLEQHKFDLALTAVE